MYFLQRAIILTFGSFKPVVKIGCTVSEFSKLRFFDMERKEDKKLFFYREDIINGIEFNKTVCTLGLYLSWSISIMNVHSLSSVNGNISYCMLFYRAGMLI
ncbi:3-deoxy-7-phosphoheptulonate synthase [Bartonella sp. 1-1C]|uniref:3-deoxy-7-phosphoheptulonate synthase n=1 Tax=Bartonella sp. 1-1C TaxID=515256 RepID=UPI001FDA6301|nr:3-deoxy-7-phosphoheptulonate synthase [Bartonella sp. 1-1C]